MSKVKELVGKIMINKDFGEVEVLRPLENSRTKVEIKVTQRAKGWDENAQCYRKVRSVSDCEKHNGKSIQWKMYNDSYSQFGHIDVCHINDLTEIN